MNQTKIVFLLAILILMTTSSSCGMLTESPEIPVSTIQQLSPTMSAAITTQTPKATPTLTLTSTHTPTLTSTMTLAPTLPLEEAGLRLLDLLANNGNCRLPCFWGITPGISSTMDVTNLTHPLGNISDYIIFRPENGGIKPYFSEYGIEPAYKENDLVIYNQFWPRTNNENTIVSRISFSAKAYIEVPYQATPSYLNPRLEYNSTYFGKIFSFYRLPHLLTDNGRPSSVLLMTLATPMEQVDYGPFDILLLYPDQGILVHYSTIMHVSDQNVIGCPANTYLELELYPSGNGDSFMESINPDWGEVLPYYKPLEEVTSMSLDQFYQTFRQPTDQCLVTPSVHWPVFSR